MRVQIFKTLSKGEGRRCVEPVETVRIFYLGREKQILAPEAGFAR